MVTVWFDKKTKSRQPGANHSRTQATMPAMVTAVRKRRVKKDRTYMDTDEHNKNKQFNGISRKASNSEECACDSSRKEQDGAGKTTMRKQSDTSKPQC